MASKTNSRRNLRVPCMAPARAEGPRGPMKGTVRSLSQAGLFFVGGQLPVGQRLELAWVLPQLGEVRCTGEVRYHATSEAGGGMGILFTRLAQEDLSRVQQFVQAA